MYGLMSMKWSIYQDRVTEKQSGQRLDQYLADAFPEVSRSKARKLIDIGGVHLDGRRIRSCSRQVESAQFVEVYVDHLPLEPYRVREEDVVYRDPYLIVLNKSAAVDTQPTHARFKGTLYEALSHYLKDPFRPHQRAELGMVQRLDRGTSGLIVFSIHKKAHKGLTEIFLEHQIEKRYLALVAAVPEPATGEIDSLLARSRKDNRVKSVSTGGKRAITRYRLVESYRQAALVDVVLLTGRSHQIRAHLAEKGCPLLGDSRYGGPAEVAAQPVRRPLLHAAQLAFKHPVTGEALEFRLPLPEDMTSLIDTLKFNTPNK